MKIRTYIQKRLIFFVSLLLISGAIFQIQLMYLENKESLLGTVMIIVSGVLGLIGIVGYLFFIKCPKCHKRFGNILGYMSINSTNKDQGIKHCPFCGVNFDEQV